MRSRYGFTIVELVVVITILGILSSLALPRYAAMKERAYVASMKSDLRNLVSAQEGFYIIYSDYAGSFGPGPEVGGLNGAGKLSFSPSDKVTIVMTYLGSTSTGAVGWNATSTHPSVTSITTDECGIYVGSPSFAPDKAVVHEGAPFCY